MGVHQEATNNIIGRALMKMLVLSFTCSLKVSLQKDIPSIVRAFRLQTLDASTA